MASLQVRELPEQIYLKLKQEAQKKHRSLAQQATITLSKGLDLSINTKEHRAEVLYLLEEFNKKRKKYKLSDPIKMVREDRER